MDVVVKISILNSNFQEPTGDEKKQAVKSTNNETKVRVEAP